MIQGNDTDVAPRHAAGLPRSQLEELFYGLREPTLVF
jgi:hypothetical protein